MLIINIFGKHQEAQRSKFTIIFNPTTRDNHYECFVILLSVFLYIHSFYTFEIIQYTQFFVIFLFQQYK